MVLLAPGPERILLARLRGARLCLPISAALSQLVAGVTVTCGGRGWGLPAAHTNFSRFLTDLTLLQNWLTESAKLIAQSGETVEWVTPLGLPIVQPYYRSKATVVSIWCAELIYRPSAMVGSREGAAGL